ncbi:MAG: DNA polymerase-3 subunit epsilon [Patiriisocius sp.]|jgi:DNA polymerase-3 subunit epsilon
MKTAMKDLTFAIIDVETTGGVSKGRMTEVCIILIKNGVRIDTFSSLINPECLIPHTITALTGIDNNLVASAPIFSEIAQEINEFTKDTVFVAHNVNFDFGFFKKEFAAVGIAYSRKKLCTVRLSRKLIPGLPSYSLGRLTRSVGIQLTGAHRAEADTIATVKLFQKLLAIDAASGYETMLNSLDVKSKEGTLPPHLPATDIVALPESPGIYLFKNQAQKVIYVGKAKNIKSRVLSHLYSKVSKEIALAQETHHIDFEKTGNELTALLLESHHILREYPKYNKVQKRPTTSYQLINYTNRKGIIQLAISKTKATTNSIATLYSNALAIEKLEQLCHDYELCPRFCSLQTQVTVCSHYKIKNCKGICEDNEDVESYNTRVHEAITTFQNEKPTYIIKGQGRTATECSIILIEQGTYKGFGFIDRSETILHFEDFTNHITRYNSTYHTTKIIQSYHKKYGEKEVVTPKGTNLITS